jgi:hypothetical protein
MAKPAQSAKLDLPGKFLWLADAPLFIDSDQVDRFYDAVVRPLYRLGVITTLAGKGGKKSASGKATGEVKGTVGSSGFLSYFFGPSPESVDDFMMYTRAEGVEPDFCNWS